MPKQKKKQTKTERREQRLNKARQWALTYQGTHIVRDYRRRFNLDYACGLEDMKSIGALSPEKFESMKRAEEIRLQKKKEQRELKQEQAVYDRFPDSDDTFFYIAGYTPGGAPYGVTWEEMGLEPYESLEDMDD
jgi:predicted DNA-binding WGR domain protein